LEDRPEAALAAVEKEVLRRRRKQKHPQPELRLLESGLWTGNPDLCWQLELRLAEKQQVEFCLLAPDEPAARADFEHEHPDLLQQREALITSLPPPEDLLAKAEAEENALEDADIAEEA
jgi:hypothetical protein